MIKVRVKLGLWKGYSLVRVMVRGMVTVGLGLYLGLGLG